MHSEVTAGVFPRVVLGGACTVGVRSGRKTPHHEWGRFDIASVNLPLLLAFSNEGLASQGSARSGRRGQG